jgi:cell division protein FtsI/penicillin-binding protein 2
MAASGEYSQGPVPTVFVEMPPPPPPQAAPREREEKGGVFISRGFLGLLVVLMLGAAIAGTGFYYMQYKAEAEKVAALEKASTDAKPVLAARDKIIADQKVALAASDKKVSDLTLQYGQIEKLKVDADTVKKNIEDVLKRRPQGTAGIPAKLQTPPPWRESAEQTLSKYVADLEKEFVRIDRMPGKTTVVDVSPAKPVIVPSGN